MPDVILERAEIEEKNRIAKELARPGLIAAALAAQPDAVFVAPVIPVDDVPPPPPSPGWVLADE